MPKRTGSTVDDEPVTDSAEVTEDAPATETKETGFYNIFDGIRGRTDGRYLDMDERVEAEQQRILRGVPTKGVDGESLDMDDYGQLPPGVGTPLVVAGQLVDNSVYSNPSVVHTDPEQVADPVLKADVPVNDESTVGPDTTTSIEDEVGTTNLDPDGDPVKEDELV